MALEMTTTEVLCGLMTQGLGGEIEDHFRTFLNRCDLVKFAKFIPSENQHQDTVKLAYQIIDETAVISEPEETGSEEDQIPDEPATEDTVTQKDQEVVS